MDNYSFVLIQRNGMDPIKKKTPAGLVTTCIMFGVWRKRSACVYVCTN